MGIKQLTKLIKDNSKKGIVERPLSFYSDKKVVIDASMFIYQFLIAVRSEGVSLGTKDSTTSHLVGLFYRTIGLVETGITPIYIFDGTPPQLKLKELKKRLERREKAEEGLKKAVESGDKLEMEKFEKRKIKVGREHVDDCMKLLNLMGIPFLIAPSEAEAFCSFLCIKKYADFVATEDMDALTFGAPFVLRNFTISQSKKVPVVEYNLCQILKDLNLNMNEFIDLCILLGCDYCDTLKGVGLKRALALIKKYRTIERILESGVIENEQKKEEKKEKEKDNEQKKEKEKDNEQKDNEHMNYEQKDYEHMNPPFTSSSTNFQFEDARTIFKELVFLDSKINEEDLKIKWNEINLEKIKEFLVNEKQFDEVRVTNGVNKLINSQKRPKQTKLDRFFVIKK